jgi:hypothetical protein
MNDALISRVAVSCRIPLLSTYETTGTMDQVFQRCENDVDAYLDVVDATLQHSRGASAGDLREILDSGASAWTVAPDGLSLQRRVDPTAQASFVAATAPADAASAELSEAWSNVYGRNPDPSDGWDHAIKAVETLLGPIVIPANPKATLGTMLSALEGKPSKWTLGLSSSGTTDGVETLSAALRLIWPNPDRHGGGQNRAPRLDEAIGVVQLAVTVVHWCRDGLLVANP